MEQQRRFTRLAGPDDAVALDEGGAELGKVVEVGGGGMLIRVPSEASAPVLQPGHRMTVTVLETSSQTRHSLDVVVRYRQGDAIGVEFVSGEK